MDKKQNDKKSETAVTESIAPSPDTKKMTIYEYEERYVKRQNVRGATFLIRAIAVLVGLFCIWCLFSITRDIWALNVYAGYVAAGVSAILFIAFYIVPVVKILRSDYFVTNVNYKTAGAAKRRNRNLRRQIAEKIVDLSSNVAGVGWYDSATVEKLEQGVKAHDDEIIKQQLSALYSGSVKKSAKEIIFKCSLKSAMYSALSQTSKTDAMLVAVVNLQMIKDIVFLYGFRPSDTRLVKIFGAVLRNSLVSYGLGGLRIGNGIARTMGDAAKGIPILGSAIAVLVDSSVQGLTNGTLTAVIGFQTIKYLNTEDKLQNILDGVEIAETEEELNLACKEIEKELKKGKPVPKAV